MTRPTIFPGCLCMIRAAGKSLDGRTCTALRWWHIADVLRGGATIQVNDVWEVDVPGVRPRSPANAIGIESCYLVPLLPPPVVISETAALLAPRRDSLLQRIVLGRKVKA